MTTLTPSSPLFLKLSSLSAYLLPFHNIHTPIPQRYPLPTPHFLNFCTSALITLSTVYRIITSTSTSTSTFANLVSLRYAAVCTLEARRYAVVWRRLGSITGSALLSYTPALAFLFAHGFELYPTPGRNYNCVVSHALTHTPTHTPIPTQKKLALLDAYSSPSCPSPMGRQLLGFS